MSADTPQWAKERAKLLLNEMAVKLDMPFCYMADGAAVLAFAAYVAAHEEPPVDPLLIEARKLAGQIGGWLLPYSWPGHSVINDADGNAREGDSPAERHVAVALAALKRGIELAKTGGDQS